MGHKVEWENDVQLSLSGDGAAASTTVCDVLLKLHQGTHSKDAFTNNLHELVYHLRCDEGTEMHVTLLVTIGRPGEFGRSCAPAERVSVGPATPANSPAGFGVRLIPDRTCIEHYMLVAAGRVESDYGAALSESWQVYNSIERADGYTPGPLQPLLPGQLAEPILRPGGGREPGASHRSLLRGNPIAGTTPAADRATLPSAAAPFRRCSSTTRAPSSTAPTAPSTSTPSGS